MSKQVNPMAVGKDLRPIIKLAQQEGWLVVSTGNNHLRWIPPKGQAVHSGTDDRVREKIVKDLVTAGLPIYKVPPRESEKKETTVETPPPEPQAQEPALPPVPIPQPPPDKKTRIRGLQDRIDRMFTYEHPNEIMTIEQVRLRLSGSKFAECAPATINGTLLKLVAQGILVRMDRGTYRLASGHSPQPAPVAAVIPAPPAAELTAEEQAALDDDERVVNDALEALGRLQEWVRKTKEVKLELLRIKKILAGFK